MEFDEQLRVVETCLKYGEGRLTKEQRKDLERCAAAMRCPLLVAAKRAILKGENEVALALAVQHVYKFARPDRQRSCVVYCRVSTESQMRGLGLWRQFDTCQQYARDRNLSIVAVFSEVASRIDPLPVRATAQRMATAQNCLLLCEDYSRWSRRGASDVPPDYVVMASQAVRDLEAQLQKAFSPIQQRVMADAMRKMEEQAIEAETVA